MATLNSNPTLASLEGLAHGSMARRAGIVVLGSLVLAGLSQIQVPMLPVPMTLQTLGVLLIGLTFGFRMASATLALYLVEGFVGLPVFAGFAYGPTALFGPTAGYLFGFLVAASVIGLMADRGMTKGWTGTIAALLVGEVIIFGLGCAWLAYLFGTDVAISAGLTPFILGDLVKVALAALIGRGLLKGASQFARL